MCGPHRRFAPLLFRPLRRIPQAVGVVATIPWIMALHYKFGCFNTASSRYYCLSPLFYLHSVQVLEMYGPHRRFAPLLSRTLLRILQAVCTVATIIVPLSDWNKLKGFNTVNSNYYFFITFVLPLRHSGKQYVGLIVTLLLYCLTLCGAYRKR